MDKKERKGTDKQKKGPAKELKASRSPQGKQRQERRNGWETKRRQKAVWEVYLDLKWARKRLKLYGAQDRALEQFFKKLEEEMAEVSMEHHGRAKQLVVYFAAASIGTRG
ncbi:hypothetical protein HaLaN_13615, partial [Haematococcus lacustris]